MKRAEIDKILNELFFEFNDKATALLDARKVFVNFDPEVQLSIQRWSHLFEQLKAYL